MQKEIGSPLSEYMFMRVYVESLNVGQGMLISGHIVTAESCATQPTFLEILYLFCNVPFLPNNLKKIAAGDGRKKKKERGGNNRFHLFSSKYNTVINLRVP
jgi:hypothetical protein